MTTQDYADFDFSEAITDPDEYERWLSEDAIEDDERIAPLPEFATSWGEVDGAALLRGDLEEPAPVLLQRKDGPCLLYAAKVSSIAGEPESGKGWFAMSAVLDAFRQERHVVYIDFEDGPKGVFGRLRALGVPNPRIEEFFHYIQPDQKLNVARGSQTRSDLAKVLVRCLQTQGGLGLIIFDGITEALTLQEIGPNENDLVSGWFGAIPRYYAHKTGASVLLIDHVVKSTDSRGRYAIGAGAKLAAIDGSQFTIEVKKPFARGRSGLVRINVTKDRPGHVRGVAVPSTSQTQAVADLVITAGDTDGTLSLAVAAPDIVINDDGKVTPTGVEAAILKYMQRGKNRQKSREHILSQVTGRNEVKRTAFNHMVDEGWLIEVRVGRKIEWRLGTPADHRPEDAS